MEEKKIDSEDLEKLKEIREEFTRVTIDMGKNNIDIIDTEQRMQSLQQTNLKLKEKYESLLKKQSEINDALADKYGDGSVDIENGVFKPFKTNN